MTAAARQWAAIRLLLPNSTKTPREAFHKKAPGILYLTRAAARRRSVTIRILAGLIRSIVMIQSRGIMLSRIRTAIISGSEKRRGRRKAIPVRQSYFLPPTNCPIRTRRTVCWKKHRRGQSDLRAVCIRRSASCRPNTDLVSAFLPIPRPVNPRNG